MFKPNILVAFIVTACLSLFSQPCFSIEPGVKDYKLALSLYNRGIYDRAKYIFEEINREEKNLDAESYALLCSVLLKSEGYEKSIDKYINLYPYSGYIPEIRYRHALNLFDDAEFNMASTYFELISKRQLNRNQRDEFLFKKAYCDFQSGKLERALIRFEDIEKRPLTDFTAPARYASGYIYYGMKDFDDAITWFNLSKKDPRFSDISNYYILESKFMIKDYKYVVKNGDAVLAVSPEDRAKKVSRLMSESYLVLGDSEKAKIYYESNKSDIPKTRSDYFYAASVLYAVGDYKGAIDKFSLMKNRTDSIGQVANYQLAYSYIKTKNKVAAMGAFEDASKVNFDSDITKDAFFNFAKLKFDLNKDVSGFKDYLKKYSNAEKSDIVYSYIAVAALYNRDYSGAIEAYDMIEELDDNMRSNYIKANYLRASSLVENGSYRTAIPYLKSVAYYTDKSTRLNQLSRFWLAESYYRDYNFDQSLTIYKDLYNNSALYGDSESYLLAYNIAYVYFKEGDYSNARRWFSTYLDQHDLAYKKEAMLRYADCAFVLGDYKMATVDYDAVINSYFDVNDIYPYYQSAMAYGLNQDVKKKIKLLSNVEKADRNSAFYPEALFELGRSYTRIADNTKAINCFNTLISAVKDSSYIAKSYIELGTVARNMSKNEQALNYYKKVVEEMPNSPHVSDALLAIETVYQSLAEPQKYFLYLESIGKSDLKSDDERERMIFNAAEQIFLSENYQRSLIALNDYITRYPSGKMMHQSYFYLAESYSKLGKKDQACDYYKKVMNDNGGSYTELATVNLAELTYELERYQEAYDAYYHLNTIAVLPNSNYISVLGMMRSAYKLNAYSNSEKYSKIVLENIKTDNDVRLEAKYILAKSYLGTSRRKEAFIILNELAQNPQTKEGAEAVYLTIKEDFDKGDFDMVKEEVYSLSDKENVDEYWLAKCFILLGDSFMEKDDLIRARATYESIESGYSSDANDEIIPLVKEKLELLGAKEAANAYEEQEAAEIEANTTIN